MLFKNAHGYRERMEVSNMKKFKNAKILTVTLITAGFLSLGSMAAGAGNSDQTDVISYKFHMLKDKISSLSVNAPENSGAGAVLNAGKPAQELDATNENMLINNIDGVKVIKVDLDKAGSEIENMKRSGPGRVNVSVDDRVRWEQNGYKATGGKNFNNSAVINRMRMNVKMNLSKEATANFSSQKTNDFGTGMQNEQEPPLNHANIVVDLDKKD